MASRSTPGAINLPGIDRRSVPLEHSPQVNIPLLDGGAQRLLAMGAITREAAKTVSAIDRKNQETAAEKQFTGIFLEAQKEINDFHATATGDEDISGRTLAIYDTFVSGIDGRGLPPAQAEIIKKKLLDRQAAIGQMGLDYELKLKAKKYDADLNATIDNAANIVAGDPRLFKDQLGNMEALIGGSRLNGAEKADRLSRARQQMGRVYLTRLAELNPAKARAEVNSEAMNGIIDPQFKTALLSKLDADRKAQASLALQDDIKSIESARRLGVAVPTEFITATAARVRAAGNERGARGLETYAGLQEYSVGFAQKPLADQQLEIKELRMKARLGDLSDIDRLEAASDAYNEKLKGIQTDPWSYYAEKGVIDDQEDSLVGATPEAAAITLGQRRLAQEKINRLEGGQVRLPLLTPREVRQLSDMKDTTDPRQLAGVLVSIGSGMDGAERRATVAAVAAKEPLLAVAMGQDFDTASRLLAGRRADGEVSKAKVREKAAETLKGVTLDASVHETFQDAIYSYYKQLALEKGETSKEAQADLVQQAVRDTVGDIADINIGRPSRVIVPAGMTAWQVEDRLNSLTDELLIEQQGQLPMTGDGFRATAGDIARFGRFMSAGDGVYAVQFPTGALYRDDGQLYTVDINAIREIRPYRRKPDALLQSRIGGSGAGQ